MRLLVLAPEVIGPDEVRDALGEAAEGAQVHVIAPALNASPLAFWVSDSDEAIAEAEEVERGSVEALDADDEISATGSTGESEPLLALQDGLAMFPAEEILVFVHPEDEQRYREDEVVEQAEERFGLPVTLHTL